MKRSVPPRLVLVPNLVGEAVVLGAEGGPPPSATPPPDPDARVRHRPRRASAQGGEGGEGAAPDELAEAAEALAALLRGLFPAAVRGADEPS